MNEKGLYKQELHPQLDDRETDIDKLKIKETRAITYTNNAMRKQLAALKCSLEEAKGKLSKLASASGYTLKSVKKGAVSFWNSLKFTVSDTPWRFKD